jgi:curved DNA-binding protein CbpA
LDHDKAYELLGVKPGVSNRELKAAHRDLAKVWHPDRFLHDPRLQEKAQEKLKEINEAYELLISGKTPRPASAHTVYS